MKTRPRILTMTKSPKFTKITRQKTKQQQKPKRTIRGSRRLLNKPNKKPIVDSEEDEGTSSSDTEVEEIEVRITRPTTNTQQETGDDSLYKVSSRISIPDVLHTEDGVTFYPCKNCCRAFAKRADLHKHQVFCRNSGVKHSPPTTSMLPLNSVENTMNSQSPKASEMNNNRNSDSAPLELNYSLLEKKLKSPTRSGQKPFEKSVKIDIVPNSIHTFELKNKLNICKTLNSVLENNGFSMTVMSGGEIVLKMHSPEYPPLEFTTKVITDFETSTEKMQLMLKPLQERGVNNQDLEWEMPEISEVLQSTFGPDVIFNTLMEYQEPRAGSSDEIMLQIDEEHFPTDDQVLLMAGNDGTIVLEDLDIHICKQCGAVYHTLQDLIAHDKYDHRKLKRKYSIQELDKFAAVFRADVEKKCPICGIKLKGNGEWPRHAQSHCEIGMFECTVCRMRFTRDDHRKNHESRHIVKK